MTPPTDVQRAALVAWRDHRVVVVRACPGSGKTRVFVDALREELERTGRSRRGIAALSFTNVAQEEIANRLGARVSPPNFVGTLDAFLWRFVVVPFGHLVGVRREGPVLVPAALEKTLLRPEVQYGMAEDRAPLFRCHIRRALDGTVGVDIKTRVGRVTANASQARIVLGAKQKLWKRTGQLTHSDASFIAAEVLASQHSLAIRTLISKRFGALLVDECQDTSGYTATALLGVLTGSAIRAFVVGDPDQSIYGFGGGSRDIMERIRTLPDAVACELDETHRCARKVASVVAALSRREAQVVPRNDAPDGNTLLVVHDHKAPRIDDVLTELSRRNIHPSAGATAVLTRKNATLEQLRGQRADHCPLTSKLGQRFVRAANALRSGDSRAAFAIASHALGDLVFDESPQEAVLQAAGIERRRWRRAVHAVLQEAGRDRNGQTWGKWRDSIKATCSSVARSLGRPLDSRRLGAALKAGKGEGDACSITRSVLPVDAGATPSVTFNTIHGVKGQEFDLVILYAPKPHARLFPCPTTEWWSSNPVLEEREVAFVGASRAKTTLVLAVHTETANALLRERSEFAGMFVEVRLTSGPRKPGVARGPRKRLRPPYPPS